MRGPVRFRWLRRLFAVTLCALCLAPPVQQLASLPSEIDLRQGERTVLPLRLPGTARVLSSNIAVADAQPIAAGGEGTDVAVTPRGVGVACVSTRLFGFVPWKALTVHVLPQASVYVGGQSVGVRLQSNGVTVVGFTRVSDQPSPAVQAHLRLGDVIEQIDGKSVHSAAEVRQLTQQGEGPCTLLVQRGRAHLRLQVQPLPDATGQRRLGVYVREKTSG
ncbi:MAG: hypothetical protein K6T31_09610, partial [Alicyclobacillus sp.]|nr:hypothetical protein [Alicyclobacillus sp.]